MMKKIILLTTILFLASCSKLTMENYQKIKVGMNYDEVTELIGKPKECAETLGNNRCVWGDEEGTHVIINFIGGAAVLFSHQGLK